MKEKESITLPKIGLPKEEILRILQTAKKQDLKWQEGKSFCLIYYPGQEKAETIREAYNLFFTENALNPVSFPSLNNFENEVVSMVKSLFHGDTSTTGTFTSGGTESILLAVKAARDYSEKLKPGIKPEIILPASAHPAFNKACQYFKIKAVPVPVDKEYRADVQGILRAINKNTIMIVGSAPSYPHGVIDPLERLSELAVKHNILFHIDACIGGFMLPFMEDLGYPIPPFDFRLEGVTSISADIHKFGYAAKGASVVLYKKPELRRAQFYVDTNWSGGIYGSTGIGGTKPGGAIAAAWAALNTIGREGYKEYTKVTLKATEELKKAILEIPELQILGNPDMSIIAFSSEVVNMYEVADELNIKGWHFERLQFPPAIHLTISQIHQQVIDSFIADLKEAVNKSKKLKLRNITSNIQVATVRRLIRILPAGILARLQSQFSGGEAAKKSRTAPLYGMMGALSGTEDLDEIVLDLLDKLHK